MKQIVALFLALFLTLGNLIPVMALAETPSGPESAVSELETLEEPGETVPPVETPGKPKEPLPPLETPLEPEEAVHPETGESPGAVPLSEFGDGDTEFSTRIRLTVLDKEDTPLAGAVYGLYKTDDSLLQELTTDAHGIATSNDVPVNTDYYLKERTAPVGYLSNTGKKEIKLTDVCAPSRVDVSARYDPIKGKLKIIKTNEQGDPLADASFIVYKVSGIFNYFEVDTVVTGADGTATTKDLLYGTYALYEDTAPEGYSSGGFYSYYDIVENDSIVACEIQNSLKKGSLEITKVGNDGKKIQGAVFGIFNAGTDAWVQDVTTGSDGMATASGLLMGDYYAMEKSVPAPYVLDESHYTFTLDTDKQVKTYRVENKVQGTSGKVKIIKTDDGKNPLSGVEFALYRSWDRTKLADLTTAEDGTVESDALIPGEYYLIETNGKQGYTPVDGQLPFTIDGSGATVEKTVVNPKIRIFGKVKIIKQDDTRTPIPGVRFGLYCDQGNLLEELTTGDDGTILSGVLNEGSYYVSELAGVDGYVMDTAQHPFTITRNESIVPVTVTNPRITGSVEVKKTGTGGEPLSGVVFGVYGEDGKERCRLTTGEDGTASSSSLYYGKYTLKEISTVDGYELLDTPIPFSVLEQDAVVEIPVTNPLILGGINVIKTDSSEPPLPLAGAVFGLYNEAGQKLDEMISDETGRASHTGLPKGKYYVKELAAPEGYILPDQMQPFRIDTQGQTQEIHVTNEKGSGTVEIVKTGEENKPLTGVRFDVIRIADGSKAGELVTDESGLASMELPLGRYELKETATAPGYTLLSGSVSFLLKNSGESVRLPILNMKAPEKGGRIQVVKTDTENGGKLSGATFGIYRAGTEERVGEFTTGSDGTAISLSLPPGAYELLELRAPDGYTANTKRVPVSVKENETAEVAIQNTAVPPKPAVLRIVKVDADSGAHLAGAVFTVQDGSGKSSTLTTGADGIASMELPAGVYTLRESKAPEGYRLNDKSASIRLDAGQTKEIMLWNTKLEAPPTLATLRIRKTDANSGAKLAGAVFRIHDTTGQKVGEFLTDQNGEAEMDLPAGTYSLQEIKAPEGYVLDGTPVRIQLEAGKTNEVSMQNTKEKEPEKPAFLRIIKVDQESGERLPGAAFSAHNIAGQKVGELLTGTDGTAFMELPPGGYVLKETKAPDGYALLASPIGVQLEAGGTKELKIENEKEKPPENPAVLRLVKVDADTADLLSGAVFEVLDASGKSMGQLTTGQDGTATQTLPAGAYSLRETAAPKGYLPLSGSLSFTLQAGDAKEIRLKNFKEKSPIKPETPGTLRIMKVDADSGAKLSGAMFEVLDDDGKSVGKLTSDKAGSASMELPAGNYALLERTAPSGYRLKNERVNVRLEAGKTTEATIKNTREDDPDQTGTLRIVKEDGDTGEPLQNAVFELLDEDGKKTEELITDRDGIAQLELAVGAYSLRESEAPRGYVLERKKISFSIQADKTKTVTVTNDRVKETQAPLPPEFNDPSPDIQPPTNNADPPFIPKITIPQTGESPPVWRYLLAGGCLGMAVLCAGALLYKQKDRKGSGFA